MLKGQFGGSIMIIMALISTLIMIEIVAMGYHFLLAWLNK